MSYDPKTYRNASELVEGIATTFEGFGEWIRGGKGGPINVIEKGDTTLNEQFNYNTVNQDNSVTYNITPPSVSPGARIIYVPVGNKRQPTVNIDIKKPPTVPNRRLPKEADGQNDTPTKAKKSISVQDALSNRKFGGLLHVPISTNELEIQQVTTPDLGKVITEANQKSGKNFALWLAQQSGTLSEADEKEIEALGGAVPVWDCSALITPQFLSGFEGEIGFLIGLEGLHALASALKNQRVNAFLPVTGLIPKSYKIKQVNPENTREYKEGKSAYESKTVTLSAAGLGGISSALGVDEFPITVPRSFVNHTDEELDKILDKKISLLQAEKAKTKDKKMIAAFDNAIADAQQQKEGKSVYQSLQNVPQQTSWLARVLDEVLGSYPYSITLKDSDLLKVGSQEQSLKIPNISEALAELQGLGIVNHSVSELVVNLLIRTLLETGTGRMQAIKNYYLLDVLRDYMGCITKDTTKEVQFSYDPLLKMEDHQGQDEFSKLLTAQKVLIDVEELNTDSTLQKHLVTIDQLYLLCKTYMARPVKSDEHLVKYIKDIASTLKDQSQDQDGKDDFDLFLENIVEKGGINEPGNTLNNQTYGRDYSRRPKTNRLNKQADPTK